MFCGLLKFEDRYRFMIFFGVKLKSFLCNEIVLFTVLIMVSNE